MSAPHINPAFVLAALEVQGYLSTELTHAIETLSAGVVPLNYDAARAATAAAIATLPVWDSCPKCRITMAEFKVRLVGFHVGGHDDQVSDD